MHGASHLPGVPLDVQGRLGMGNLIPGTSAGKLSTADVGKEVAEMLGPVGSLGKNIVEGGKALLGGDLKGASKALPILGSAAIQNVIQAVDMWQTGMYRNSRGAKVIDTTPTEAVIKGIGFQPTSVAAKSKRDMEQNQDIALHKAIEARIASAWAQGRFELAIAKNGAQVADAQEKIREARKQLADWNEKNPEAKIVITPQQIMSRVGQLRLTREQRTVKRAPREIRSGVRRELADEPD
jgi:hypothetical protein